MSLRDQAREPAAVRVLVVEDNPGDVDLVRDLLRPPSRPEWHVESAHSLENALARLDRGNGIDVILLNLRLPDAEGLDAAARLRSAVPHLPLVVLTGLLGEDAGIEAVRHGAQEYLVKGAIDALSLQRALRYAIERKQAEEVLRRAQKLESLGILAGGVAHDFNNMLSTILGHATLARRVLPPGSQALHHLEKIVHATTRAADLTRQMLAYSGRGRFHVRTSHLNGLVRECLHLFEAAIPKNARLTADLGEELPAVEAEIGQIQQLVMNLILNGAEALGDREGDVTVSTRAIDVGTETPSESADADAPMVPGRYVELTVSDTGCGMDPLTVARMFDPFFTTKPGGRGLGLAAVFGIGRGHGGRLRVASEPGRGTTFRVLLPASARTVPQAAPAPPDPVDKGLILVIEDDPDLRETASVLLSVQGFPVVSAANGRAGAALFAERRSEVALVLLDLSMPGWSAAHTMRELRRADPTVRILLSSGFSADEASKGLADDEVTGFLQKPYGFEDIAHEVRRCLATPASTKGGVRWIGARWDDVSDRPTSRTAGS